MHEPIRNNELTRMKALTDLQKKVLQTIYEAPNEGLRLWQVQKKAGATKLEAQQALHILLAEGFIGISSMGGGPKYHKIASKADLVASL